MFKSDQPIQTQNDDLLGRSAFAKSLGKAILSYGFNESISIGLFGEWGSGKTSIINMALEEISSLSKKLKKSEKEPLIIKFNPWNFSDQHQLITQFFSQLSTALNNPDKAKKHIKLGQAIQNYASFFEPFSYVPGLSVLGNTAKAIKGVGSAAQKAGELQSKDLNEIKIQINSFIKELEQTIIIVIDDIDRLNNTEIRQVFQLVKSLGDFPNTIYLLSFDKKVVINALKKVQEGPGHEYLEKVIQVPFEIPTISKHEVEKLLFGQIDEIINKIPEDKFDQTYWGNIYHSGLKYFFKNIRDVTRYTNSLRFSFEMVKDEVNVIDFLAMTAIQVFIPNVYYGIRDNQEVFSGIYNDRLNSSAKIKEHDAKICDDVIKKVDFPSYEILKDFFQRLFPKLESIYGNMGYSYSFLENWRKEGRVCSPDNFNTFFSLSIPKGELSKIEIEQILQLGNNVNNFSEALIRLKDENKIIRFLERLEDYTEDVIPRENICPIVNSLMDLGDLFPEGDPGFYEFGTSMKVFRLFCQLSHRLETHQERFLLFKEAFEKANSSLYTIVNEVGVQMQQHAEYSSKKEPTPLEQRTVAPEHLTDLKEIAREKIELWAKDGRLADHDKLVSILDLWQRVSSAKKVKNYVSKIIIDDNGLISFITSFLSKTKSRGMSDYVGKIHWRVSVKNIEDFVAKEEVEPRIRKIYKKKNFNKLDKTKKLAIQTFIDTVDGKIDDRF